MVTLLKDFIAQPWQPIQFAVFPYAPVGGCIALLYGKTSVGKSPLTWELARCIATGEPFFGHQAVKGRVLYLDLDTPPDFVRPRLAQIDVPDTNYYVEFSPVLNIFQAPAQDYLLKLKEDVQPIYVIINTLRKLYAGEEKDGSLPSRLYAVLRRIFSPAGILLVHHDKKAQGPALAGPPDEAFSGHMAWLNDAQVGLHLMAVGGMGPRGRIRLVHTKSQVSEQQPDLLLLLDRQSTRLVAYRAEQAASVLKAYTALPPEMGKTVRVRAIAVTLGYSERTIWTILSRTLLDETVGGLLQDSPPQYI